MNRKIETQHPFTLGLWIAFGFFVFPFIVGGVVVFSVIVIPVVVLALAAILTAVCELPAWALFMIVAAISLVLGYTVLKWHRALEIKRAQRIVAIIEASERR